MTFHLLQRHGHQLFLQLHLHSQPCYHVLHPHALLENTPHHQQTRCQKHQHFQMHFHCPLMTCEDFLHLHHQHQHRFLLWFHHKHRPHVYLDMADSYHHPFLYALHPNHYLHKLQSYLLQSLH
ncbi:hypothetical protein V8G54_014684 [Vigna mungo]|uniref:Uncharacterized protein n=1 Tax=Vigna mungo TaxID=3915 RepID=A0AAQ3NH48_VIGMU